jgi:hypothetical protein
VNKQESGYSPADLPDPSDHISISFYLLGTAAPKKFTIQFPLRPIYIGTDVVRVIISTHTLLNDGTVICNESVVIVIRFYWQKSLFVLAMIKSTRICITVALSSIIKKLLVDEGEQAALRRRDKGAWRQTKICTVAGTADK